MRPLLRSLLLLLALGTWLRPGSAQAQGESFSCDGTFYQIRQVGTTSYLYTVNRTTATYSTVALNVNGGSNNLGVLLNGLAYNSQDGYLYALTTPGATGSNTNSPISLYKIGKSGIVKVGGNITVGGNNLAMTVASGTFDKAGNYYFSAQNTAGTANYGIYKIAPTSANPTVATQQTPTGSTNITLYDIAFNPADNLLYGVNFVGSLYRYNQNTNVMTTVSTAPAANQNVAGAVGTIFFDVAGNLYTYSNGTVGTANSSQFYEVDLTTGTYTTISTIDPASVSDGASCINPGSAIDVTKELTNVRSVSASTFEISYAIRVRNTYTVSLNNVQVSDLLDGNTNNSNNVPFPSATAITIVTPPVVTNYDGAALAANGAYTGLSATPSGSTVGGGSLLSGNQTLTPGQRALITYTVRVQFGNSAANVPNTARNNTAYATSTSSSPNRGYTLTSTDVLLTPNDLVADDASTNGSNFPALRSTLTNGTPDAVDSPVPTPVTFLPSISGTVFEDVNYGGGAGRSQGTSQGVSRANARVELYSGSGQSATFVTAQNTAADGSYSFLNLAAGANYVVRVVNSTVTSSRGTGAVAVQTFRTSVTAADGTVPDLNRVGGESPQRADAGNGSGTVALSTLSNTTTTAESIANVTLPTTNAPAVNVDFGYNFDLIVNTNDAGQGSLRQFIANANAMGNEAALAQVYTSSTGATTALPIGVETSIFMIPSGNAVAGQLGTLANGLNANGVAVITPTTALPIITGPTNIDGTTQTFNIGNTNNVTLGMGGTVGTNSTALAQLNGPEVQLTGSTAVATGLSITGANSQVKGLAIYGFGNNVDDNGNANIAIAANNVTVTNNALGSTATSFSVPTVANVSANVRVASGTGVSFTNNLVGFAGGSGIYLGPTVTGAIVTGNEIRGNGRINTAFDGVDSRGSSTTVTGNLFADGGAQGFDSFNSAGSNNVTGNTFTNNGTGNDTSAPQETAAARFYGTGNTFSQNISTSNYGAGVEIASGTTLISRNSIYNNGNVVSAFKTPASGQVGIDLIASNSNDNSGSAPYVTLNSATTGGANSLVNYPILRNATFINNNLVMRGYAKAGATIELFLAQPNPAGANTTGANFGQGRTYLLTLTEGATTGIVDTDPSINQSYSGTINGFAQGSDNSANGFTFTIPLSTFTDAQRTALLNGNAMLTSTATLNNVTSEYSGNVRASATPLPVVLTALTAQAEQNGGALLTWTTASEVNSAYFEVERSLDGTSYTKIGQLAAKGNSATSSTYTFTDANAAARATGAVYYRLRQVDLDATASFSPVRTVTFAKVATAALSLYPNPAQNATALDVSALPATGTYQVLVLDATGRVVRTARIGGGQLQPLSLTDLASGTYQVLVTGTLANGDALRQAIRFTKE